ncbi:MAG: leucyl/phenylalanyl-tRNA--protein transferase [Dongiaceae bacterium]
MNRLTPDMLLRAYAYGVFPMAEGRLDPAIHWIEPEHRGIIPLDSFHVPRRLARTVRHGVYDVRCNSDFVATIRGCADSAPGRRDTWINRSFESLHTRLHEMGFAHSIEAWRGGELVGGLYGIALGGAFFGESMFNRARDASKVALVHLVARLRVGHFSLLDAQFVTEHLTQFGAHEISREAYRERLAVALGAVAQFPVELSLSSVVDAMQSITQTS